MKKYYSNIPKFAYKKASGCIRNGKSMEITSPVEAKMYIAAFDMLQWKNGQDELAYSSCGLRGWLTKVTPVRTQAQLRRYEILTRLPGYRQRQIEHDAEYKRVTGKTYHRLIRFC